MGRLKEVVESCQPRWVMVIYVDVGIMFSDHGAFIVIGGEGNLRADG